jgi:F0F1-type ATP synthase assembly protein I
MLDNSDSDNETGDKPPMNSYMRFSSVGIQMGVVIFVGVWGGMKLDQKMGNTNQLWTVICSLLGVFLGLYFVLKEVLKFSKSKNEESDNIKKEKDA